MFRNKRNLKAILGEDGFSFLKHSLGAIERLLPHVQTTKWIKCDAQDTKISWGGKKRRSLKLTLVLSINKEKVKTYAIKSTMTRKKALKQGEVEKTIDLRERDLCERILKRITRVLKGKDPSSTNESLRAIQTLFDEQIVSSHLQRYNDLELDVSEILHELRKLAEQSYENKSISFGCLLDSNRKDEPNDKAKFPSKVLAWKKLRAISDGYRTAYRISSNGKIIQFEDLIPFRPPTAGRHFYPEWADCIANASNNKVCGLCLTRQGDLLVFDSGTLRFTYRFGKWQFWNHSHIVNLVTNRARAQKVPRTLIGKVVNTIYRSAMDVSFRRCGGLFVLLRNKDNLHKLVAKGDAIGDRSSRSDKTLMAVEDDFDSSLPSKKIQELSPRLIAELAGLDGAVVLNNKGDILSFGAVLLPKKKGKTGSAEGSRTKAAIGASMYGIAIKISSDGDISFFEKGKEFLVT